MKRLLALLLLLTVAFCAPAAAETARRPLASGDTGEAVAELQQRLQDLGLSTGEADGIYGRGTQAAVTRARKDLGLPVRDAVDEAFYRAIGLILFE